MVTAGRLKGKYRLIQPTYSYWLMRKLRAYAVSEDWATKVPSLINKDSSLNIGEIYDYDNVVLLDKTFIMTYERTEEHEPFNLGASYFRSLVNMTIDIRSGNKNDYWVIFRFVRHALKSMVGNSELINAGGVEKKYYLEYRGSTDLSDKLKKLWRRNLEVRIYTLDGV